METKQVIEASFKRRVQLVFSAREEPLNDCAGDDEMLTTKNELSEPNETDNVQIECDWNSDVRFIIGTFERSMLVVGHHQLSRVVNYKHKTQCGDTG